MIMKTHSNELQAVAASVGRTAYEPVGRETLHQQIYSQIKERLITGQFLPGERLTLRSLAEALGTSAMPVRDALQRLESVGALVVLRNRRMSVPQLTKNVLEEIREIRIAIEGLAAERAAQFATPDQLKELENSYREMADAAEHGDPAGFFRANWRFHLSVALASQSSMIVPLLESLWLKIGPSLRLSKPDKTRLAAALPIHLTVLEAIQKRDASAARLALTEDITTCFDMITSPLGP